MSRLAGFKIQETPHRGTDKTAKTLPAHFAKPGTSELTKLTEPTEPGFGSFGSTPLRDFQKISAPVWVAEFPNGKRYVLRFDPPITAAALLEKWGIEHPGQPITVTSPIPQELLEVMHTAANRNAWCAETWPRQIGMVADALDSGRATLDELIAGYSNPPPGYEPPPVEPHKADILNTLEITRYTAKPAPAFELQAQTAPKAPERAVELLSRLGVAVHYHQESGRAETAVRALLAGNPKLLGLDIETMPLPAFKHDPKAGLDPYKGAIRLIQIADKSGSVHVFDMATLTPAVIKPLLGIPCISHNAGFEYRLLKQVGIIPEKLHCSYLLSRLIEGNGLSLAAACSKRLGLEIDKALQVSDWSNPHLSPEQIAYAGLDAVLTLRLWDCYGPLIKATGQTGAYKRFAQAVPIVGDQMLAGVGFDSAAHKTMMQAWRDELEPLREQLGKELGNVNPDSPQQLAGWLTRNLDAKTLAAWPKTPSGQLATGADTLAGMDHPAIATLKRYSELTKQLSTFGVGYASHIHPVTGRLHADYGIAGTRGGRFSCRNPNLQNPPRDSAFRALFKAREGYQLIVADYSQVELRIAAILADDPVMLACYQRGDDLHKRTAAALAGIPESEVTKAQRQLAKAVNFGLVYGMGAKTLAAYAKASYGVAMELGDAEKAHATYFKTYPGIRLWHSKTKAKGFSSPQVRTQGGLLRDFSVENGFQLTSALNTPVQGSGAECLVEALLRLPAALRGLDARLVHHVHDEIVLECSHQDTEKAKAALTESMIGGFLALFPDHPMPGLVEAHSGPDWHSAKG